MLLITSIIEKNTKIVKVQLKHPRIEGKIKKNSITSIIYIVPVAEVIYS